MRPSDFAFSPDEWGDFFVVGGNERLNGLYELPGAFKACSAQGFTPENAEPDFYLIEPTCRRRREVEMHVRMPGEPIVIFLVGAVIVEDDMDLSLSGDARNDFVQKQLEVGALLGYGVLSLDRACGNVERGKQIDRAMSLIQFLI